MTLRPYFSTNHTFKKLKVPPKKKNLLLLNKKWVFAGFVEKMASMSQWAVTVIGKVDF